jgi:SAM-dependent methyltransferase
MIYRLDALPRPIDRTDIPQVTRTEGWLATRTGRDLLTEEVRHVRRALDGLFGDQFVQVGVWGDAGLFRRLPRTRRVAVVGESAGQGADLVSAGEELALAAETVDVVLLPHTLERTEDPHGVLREVDRVLRPGGHVIILGFNPFGWWGARHLVSRRRFPPVARRMISDGRLRDWLRLLEFRVHQESFYYFAPPITRRAVRRVPADLDALQARGGEPAAAAPAGSDATGTSSVRRRAGGLPWPSWLAPLARWSGFGSCYVLVARKERLALTPIRLAWRRRAALVGGLVNPTTRNAA